MLKLMKKTALICATLLMMSTHASTANAENMVNLGATGVWLSSPYKNHDDLAIPFPMIHWEAKHFYVRGFSAGVFLWSDDYEMNELSLGLGIGAVEFSNKDTSNYQLSALNDRERTLDAYLQYILRTQYGNFGARLSHDTLGNADGFMANAFYQLPINIENFTLTPGAGIQLDTQDRLNYFYGVSAYESNRSGLSQYQPDFGFSPFLSLDAKLIINNNLNFFITGKMNFLSNEIEKSPMVGTSTTFFSTFGATYSF